VRVLGARASLPVIPQHSPAGTRALLKNTSTPPAGEGSAAQLFYYPANAMLSWGYSCLGDYDQNGEVNIADLTPLAQHLGEVSAGGPGTPFSPSSLGGVVDGDGNGEINIGDVTPLGMNFGARVAGYRVYSSERADAHPGEPDAPNGPGTSWLAAVALDVSTKPTARRQLSLQVSPTPTLQYYWVRPYDGALDGAASNDVEVVIPPNQPPVAALTPTGGTATLAHVVWDASASRDPEGPIVRYEWDFDNDGVYEYDATAAAREPGGETIDPAHQDYYYYDPGTFNVSVRVTDGGGLTATTTAQVTITQAQTWHQLVADSRLDTFDQGRFRHTGIYETGVSLLNVNHRPALVYARSLDEHNTEYNTDYATAYLIADDSTGASWPEPQIVPGALNGGKATVVDGLPAILYSMRKEYTDPDSPMSFEFWTYYIRASAYSGVAWQTKKQLSHWSWNYERTEWQGSRLDLALSFLTIDGAPTIIGRVGNQAADNPYTVFIRALNPTGTSWPQEFQHLEEPLDYPYDSITVVAGRLAMAKQVNGEDVLYSTASDSSAQAWTKPTLVDKLEQAGSTVFLLDAQGFPAIMYYDDLLSAVKYRRSLDADGSAWAAAPVPVSVSAADDFQAMIVGGRPTVIYFDRIDKLPKFISANNSDGTLWGMPSTLPEFATYNDTVGALSIVDIDGLPGYAYVSPEDQSDPSHISHLYYLAYN